MSLFVGVLKLQTFNTYVLNIRQETVLDAWEQGYEKE